MKSTISYFNIKAERQEEKLICGGGGMNNNPAWLHIVDNIRKVFQETTEYVYIPDVCPQVGL